MSPANKALWLRLALPLLPPGVSENTLHPVEYQKENKQRALLQSNTVQGTVLPGLCLPHWKQDRATGLCEPYFLHPGPLKPESIKSSKVGKTLFLIKINFLLFVMSKMPQLQPATLHFPLHPAFTTSSYVASLAMPQKSSTSMEERELHLLSVSHVPNSLIRFIRHHLGRKDVNIFWGGNWTKPAQGKTEAKWLLWNPNLSLLTTSCSLLAQPQLLEMLVSRPRPSLLPSSKQRKLVLRAVKSLCTKRDARWNLYLSNFVRAVNFYTEFSH